MRQNCFRYCLSRSNHVAIRSKSRFEILTKALEQLNMLGFLAGKFQQGAGAEIVRLKLWACMVQHERQNKLFDKSEDAQVGIASNLIKYLFLFISQEGKRLHACQGFGHKGPREVEPLFTADNVFDSPMNRIRCGQS